MKKYFPIQLFLLIIIAFVSCSKSGNEIIDTDKCIFIDEHTNVHGTLLSGPRPPLISVDFPTYSFNINTGELTGIIDFDLTPSLKIIYGSGASFSGTAGSGSATGLKGVYSIPYKEGIFEITEYDSDGKIKINYKDSVLFLAAGEKWVIETNYNDTTREGNEISISKITSTTKIENFGIINKSNIVVEKW